MGKKYFNPKFNNYTSTYSYVFYSSFAFGSITSAWFGVIIINSVLPISGTNMFLIPYGIDKKSTAYSVIWTTILCVAIVMLLITSFEIYFP